MMKMWGFLTGAGAAVEPVRAAATTAASSIIVRTVPIKAPHTLLA